MLLRCTAKLLTLIGDNIDVHDAPPADDDWYANVLRIDRKKCLLVTHAGTLFSTFIRDVRVHQLRPPGPLTVNAIRASLRAEGLPGTTLGPLDAAVRVAKTADRRVLGAMNDLTSYCGTATADSRGLRQLDLATLEHQLHRHLMSTRGCVPPIDLAIERSTR